MKQRMIVALLSCLCLFPFTAVLPLPAVTQTTLDMQSEEFDLELLTRARRHRSFERNKKNFTSFGPSNMSPIEESGAFFTDSIEPNLPIPAILLPPTSHQPSVAIGILMPSNLNPNKPLILEIPFLAQAVNPDAPGDATVHLVVEGFIAHDGKRFPGSDNSPNFVKRVAVKVHVGSDPVVPTFAMAKFKIKNSDIRPGDFIFLKIKRDNLDIPDNNQLKAVNAEIVPPPMIVAIVSMAAILFSY